MSTVTVAPLKQAIYTALKTYIASVLPDGVQINQGLGNRVSAPLSAAGFVYMTILFRQRLQTNQESYDTDTPPDTLASENAVAVTVQIDCYGADAFDWAEAITNLWRSQYAVLKMAPTCAPLYADEARELPLSDSEGQYESRYSITAVLQYNPTTVISQTFADTLSIEVINANEAYPP